MNYLKIEHDDVCNGIGIRCTIWFTGCSHKCTGCFNKETWDENSGIEFDIEAKKELFDELSKDYISGITFSGGDPLHENNIIEVNNIIQEIKKQFPNKTIWLYTGYTWEELFPTVIPTVTLDCLDIDRFVRQQIIKFVRQQIIKFVRQQIIKSCNVVIDGPYIDDLRDITLKWRGSSNQRVIDVQKTLQNGEIVLWTD